MNEALSGQKTAYICNANCEKRYGTQPEEVDTLRQVLTDKGYDIRTRGCLSICNEIGEASVEFKDRAIVNVELIDDSGGISRRVAGHNPDGSIGMMDPAKVSAGK